MLAWLLRTLRSMNVFRSFLSLTVGASIVIGSAFAAAPPLNLTIGSTTVYALPGDRHVPWEVGVPGGIPGYAVGVNVKNAPFNAVGDGLADDTAAFRAAIAACAVGNAVYVPAGTYKLTGPLQITKGIVLRGAGSGSSVLLTSASSGVGAIFIYGSSSSTVSACVSGYTKGATSLALASASGFHVGDYARIQQSNDSAVVEGSVPSWSSIYQGQMFRVTSISGNTIGINRPLYYTYNPALNIQVKKINCVVNAGVEDLLISMSGTCDSIVYVCEAAGCWVQNVESTNCNQHHVCLDQTFECEVRTCYFHNATTFVSGGYGMSLCNLATDNLVEDNIMYYLRHGVVLQDGASGNAVAYNYTAQTFGTDPAGNPSDNYLMPSILCHGGHPIMNLVEGNIASELMCDNYWGSSRDNTFLRNWSQRYSLGLGLVVQYGLWPVRVDAQNYYESFVGNILGMPGQTYNYVHSSTNLLGRDNSRLTNPMQDDLCYPVVDSQAQATLIYHGNYDFALGATFWDPTDPSRTIPSSFYLSGKPSWFGSLSWPPFGPDVNTSSSIVNSPAIPAQARFLGISY